MTNPATPTPTVAPLKQVAEIAKATGLKGAAAEATKQSARPFVVTMPVEGKKTRLAYITPLQRGGFRVLVAHYGKHSATTVATVAAAAVAVKTSERITPKVRVAKPAPAKKAPAKKPAAKKAPAASPVEGRDALDEISAALDA